MTLSKEYYTKVKITKRVKTTIKVSPKEQLETTDTDNLAEIEVWDGKKLRKEQTSDLLKVESLLETIYKDIEQAKDQKFEKWPAKEIEHKRAFSYADRNITHIPTFMKKNMCKDFHQAAENMLPKMAKELETCYEDLFETVSEKDSSGAEHLYDVQIAWIKGTWSGKEIARVSGNYFDELAGEREDYLKKVADCKIKF